MTGRHVCGDVHRFDTLRSMSYAIYADSHREG
jgi:hypothetical protein